MRSVDLGVTVWYGSRKGEVEDGQQEEDWRREISVNKNLAWNG